VLLGNEEDSAQANTSSVKGLTGLLTMAAGLRYGPIIRRPLDDESRPLGDRSDGA